MGRGIHNDRGPVLSAWCTYFPPAGLVAHGREREVFAFLDWLKEMGFLGARILSCWGGTSQTGLRFTPQEGIAAMPGTLGAFRDRGMYGMPVGAVDTKLFNIDWPAHLRSLGNICQGAQMPMEGGQEIPHSTQDDRADDWVKAYRPPAPVMYCEGSVHGQNDGSMALGNGHFICTHVLRDVEQVGRHNQVADAFYPKNKPFVSMEPDKAMNADTWYRVAKKCREREMGLTFHHQDVSWGIIPTGAALDCARAMLRGLRGE